MRIIAAIHGIMTRQTDASWPDHFDAWMARRDAGVRVVKKEYAAGPFPRLNWWKNRKLARGLVVELETLAGGEEAEIWMVAHSNGCVIALMAARMLIADGFHVSGLILTGAACESDVRRTGILDWILAGDLGKAVAYCSRQDWVVDHGRHGGGNVLHRVKDWAWGVLSWPYGDLGRRGWTVDGKGYFPKSSKVYSRWYDGGHSVYWAAGKRNCTFEQVYQDTKH
jgi:predicted alpha/beta hydrolase family esterase